MINLVLYDANCICDRPEYSEYSVDEMFNIDDTGYSRNVFICPDEIMDDGSAVVNEELIERAKAYDFEVVNDIANLDFMYEKLTDIHENSLLDTDSLVIVVDDLTNWMIGYDREATCLEDMYSEQQTDMLSEIGQLLLRMSRTHKIIMRCGPMLINYYTERWHERHYRIDGTNYEQNKNIVMYDWMKV